MRQGAIVLCGGQSTRMGHPKAMLPFGREVMLNRVLSRLNTQSRIVVAAPDQVLPPLPPDVVVTRDEHPGRGPLEGLLAGLRAGESFADAFYATGCDVPLLRASLVQQLFDLLADDDDIVVPRDGKHHHPLAAVYRPRIVPTIEKLLADDRRRPFFLFSEVRTREVDVEGLRSSDPDLDSLLNVNSPDDYVLAMKKAGLKMSPEMVERFDI